MIYSYLQTRHNQQHLKQLFLTRRQKLQPLGHIQAPPGHSKAPPGYIQTPLGHIQAPLGHIQDPPGHLQAPPPGHLQAPRQQGPFCHHQGWRW